MTDPTVKIIRFTSLEEGDNRLKDEDNGNTSNDTSQNSSPAVSTALLAQKNIQQDKIFTEVDEVDTSIAKYTMPLTSQKPPITLSLESPDEDCCIFCLEGGDLIHTCSCSVMTHKECALEYIRFPGTLNQYCCQCRERLDYKIQDVKTPMKRRYIIAFILLVFVYMATYALAIYCTHLLIPRDKIKNIYIYMSIVANIGLIWPLIILYIISFIVEWRIGPRPKQREITSSSSSSNFNPNSKPKREPISCLHTGCYCSGGCDIGDCNCGGGDDCGMLICLLCVLGIVLVILIAASGHVIVSLFRQYRSFKLKSKTDIVFKHENRQLNTLAYVNS